MSRVVMAPRTSWTAGAFAMLALLALLAIGCSDARPQTVALTMWGCGREGEEVRKLLDEFERTHPGITVRVQQLPWTAAHEKLLTAFVGRQSPDLVQLGNTWVPEFAEIGALEPLDRYISESTALTPASYFSGIWETNRYREQTFGVPWYVDTRVLFYRTDLLQKAGIQRAPRSWQELSTALAALKRNAGPAQWPIFLPTDEWAQPAIFGVQAGSSLLRDHDTYGAFRGPEFRRAADFYVGLFQNGWAPRANNREVINAYQQFSVGDIQMWITGPWNLGEFRRLLPPELQDKWATAPLPSPDGVEPGYSLAGGSSVAIFRSSQHKREAWQLVEFLSSPQAQVSFYRLVGDLPARIESWSDPILADDLQARAFWQQLQFVKPMPRVPEWEQVAQLMVEDIERSIRGGVALDVALPALDEKVDRALNKRRWMLTRRSGQPASW